ncbi:MAG TPA: chemotaxis protein CheA [Thermodesulfovibrionales bacterium]|nr:chemotaxis protein CheA [Thermodesulfovibrionales bacterium]
MSDDLEEIISEFLTEAEESLDKMDPIFVEIEKRGSDADLLNEAFRVMHTLKGAAGFLGFQQIVDVAHSAENILKKLREGEISLTKDLTDVILKSVDMLRLLIEHIKIKDGESEDTAPILAELDSVLNKTVDCPDAAAEICVLPPEVLDEGERQDETEEHGGPADREGTAQEEKEKTYHDRREHQQTLRVDIGKLDKVMDLTGEVVLVRNRLLNIVNYLETKYSDDPFVQNLFETVSFLDLVTSDMQVAVMKMRMQPIKKVFGKFPRMVRDMSSALGKDVNLKIFGEDTEVDKSVIEHIGDPLVHIIRNSLDHGMEHPEERRSKQKDEKGTIEIHAYQKGNQIVIEVSDDGKGIDIDRVKKKALANSLISDEEAARMSEADAINLIFLPGFSTVDVATELSGRGVGMDVVKTNISKLNGYVEVVTKRDEGTTFKISIPLTLAIIQVLMVRSGKSFFAIPLTAIEETLKVSGKEIADVVGQKVINIRGRVLPIYELSEIIGSNGHEYADQRYVVVISLGETKFCLSLDELLGQEEIVIKNIDGLQTDSSYVLGATITGDGKVVLILDPAGISRNKLGAVKV